MYSPFDYLNKSNNQLNLPHYQMSNVIHFYKYHFQLLAQLAYQAELYQVEENYKNIHQRNIHYRNNQLHQF
ncbi:hypothetical protein D1872_328970 [compost metagenome]